MPFPKEKGPFEKRRRNVSDQLPRRFSRGSSCSRWPGRSPIATLTSVTAGSRMRQSGWGTGERQRARSQERPRPHRCRHRQSWARRMQYVSHNTHGSKALASLASDVTTCTGLLSVSTAVQLAGVPTYPPIQVSRYDEEILGSSRPDNCSLFVMTTLPRAPAAFTLSIQPKATKHSSTSGLINLRLRKSMPDWVNGVPVDLEVAITGVGLQAAVPPEGGAVVVQATSSDVFVLVSGGTGGHLSNVTEAKQIVSELGGIKRFVICIDHRTKYSPGCKSTRRRTITPALLLSIPATPHPSDSPRRFRRRK